MVGETSDTFHDDTLKESTAPHEIEPRATKVTDVETTKLIRDEDVVPVLIEIRKGGSRGNDLVALIVIKDGEDDDDKGNFYFLKGDITAAKWLAWLKAIHDAIMNGTKIKVSLNRLDDEARRFNDHVESKHRKKPHTYLHFPASNVQ